MALKTEEIYDKAMALSGDVEHNFLELGKTLRKLIDRDPDLFQQIVKKRKLGRRKAYYLVEVSRAVRSRHGRQRRGPDQRPAQGGAGSGEGPADQREAFP